MSCLFQSLSKYTGDTTARELRNMICDYLAAKMPLFPDSNIGDFGVDDAYITEMRKETTFGGAIEISAFCNLYSVRVIVRNVRDNTPDIIFEPLNGSPRRVAVIEWSGNHYEAV